MKHICGEDMLARAGSCIEHMIVLSYLAANHYKLVFLAIKD
jgi:hypothetical protein